MANMTLGEAKIKALQLVNEYSTSGELILTTDPNYQDLVLRMNPLANDAQIEIAKLSKIYATRIINHDPIPNLLGLYASNEVSHSPGTDLTYSAVGAKSFSVDVGKFACNIYFYETISGVLIPLDGTYSKDGGTAIAFTGSISITGADEYTNYKGLFTASSVLNVVTMKIVATYRMKSRNRALFAYGFPTAVNVPYFTSYVSYDLGVDYMEFDRMMREFDERQYQENQDYILTNDNKIHLNWFLTGQFIVHYWKWPAVITNTTPDSYAFEVGIDGQSAIPWKMGGYAIFPTNKALGGQLLEQYYILLQNLNKPKANVTKEVQNTLWAVSSQSFLDKLRT